MGFPSPPPLSLGLLPRLDLRVLAVLRLPRTPQSQESIHFERLDLTLELRRVRREGCVDRFVAQPAAAFPSFLLLLLLFLRQLQAVVFVRHGRLFNLRAVHRGGIPKKNSGGR